MTLDYNEPWEPNDEKSGCRGRDGREVLQTFDHNGEPLCGPSLRAKPENFKKGVAKAEGYCERSATCVNALAGIPNEQIARDAKLYAHVGEMHLALVQVAQVESGDAYDIAIQMLAKLEESQ